MFMRPGQQNNKRLRGRNRKGPNPLTRSYESNGPDVKIRGTALHIAEKYGQLARDAQSAGDRVAAENYYQHAEHYYRIIAAAQAQMPFPQQQVYRNSDDLDDETDELGARTEESRHPRQQHTPNKQQPRTPNAQFRRADQQPGYSPENNQQSYGGNGHGNPPGVGDQPVVGDGEGDGDGDFDDAMES